MGLKGGLSVWEAESWGFQLMDATIGDLLDQRAEELPDKEALVFNYPEDGIEVRLTYRQYRDEIDRLARSLIALGIGAGEHVAVWAPNLPEWALLHGALAKIGAVLVTVNTAYRASEVEYVLRQGDVSTLFLVEEYRGNSYLDSIYGIVPELHQIASPLTDILSSPALPRLKRVILIGESPKSGLALFKDIEALADSVTPAVLKARQRAVSPNDVAQMQYTSGTTGFPKAVMLSHNNMLNQAHLSCSRSTLTHDERQVTAMPFFHVAGSVGGLIFSLYLGCTLIPLIGFDPAKELELLAIEKATFSFNVPTMLLAMMNHPRFLAGEFDLTDLREITTGATPVPLVLMEQVKEKMGANCSVVYGMTETSGAVTQSMPTDLFERRAATAGLPEPHTDIRIVDPFTNAPVPLGEQGELVARGPLIMLGYYNMPDRTAETIDADGFLHSGDLATMDEHGYVKIVGRVKDMIIRGGENLYPAEIESFLMRHPAIEQAQVVGVPDPYMGEEAAAVICVRAGHSINEEEIRQYCLAEISRHKVPRYICFVDSYPLTSSGKVKKFELSRLIATQLGLEP